MFWRRVQCWKLSPCFSLLPNEGCIPSVPSGSDCPCTGVRNPSLPQGPLLPDIWWASSTPVCPHPCPERWPWAESPDRDCVHTGPVGGPWVPELSHAVSPGQFQGGVPRGCIQRIFLTLGPGRAATAWRCPLSPRRGNKSVSNPPGREGESHSPRPRGRGKPH